MIVRRTRSRPGFTLLELTLAVLLIMTAMGVLVRVLAWIGTERRAADRRVWAAQEVANVMERVTSEPFDRLTRDRAEAIARTIEAQRILPNASWEFDIADQLENSVPSKRVAVGLRWSETSGAWESAVRLTAWVYRGRPQP